MARCDVRMCRNTDDRNVLSAVVRVRWCEHSNRYTDESKNLTILFRIYRRSLTWPAPDVQSWSQSSWQRDAPVFGNQAKKKESHGSVGYLSCRYQGGECSHYNMKKWRTDIIEEQKHGASGPKHFGSRRSKEQINPTKDRANEGNVEGKEYFGDKSKETEAQLVALIISDAVLTINEWIILVSIRNESFM